MRVILVTRSFPALSETFIVAKFLGLLRRGVDAHVVASEVHASAFAAFPEVGQRHIRARIHRHPPMLPLRPTSVVPAARAAGVVVTARHAFAGDAPTPLDRARQMGFVAHQLGPLLALRPDLVHFEFGTLARGVCGPLRRLAIPTVVSFRGFDLNLSGLDDAGYYDDVWDYASAFHFLGTDLRARAIERGCPPGRLHRLIAPAVAASRFPSMPRPASLPSPDRPLRILSVGRLHWKKGYEWGLEAIRIAARKVPIEYRIVGDGDHRAAVAYARHQLGLGAVVDLLGPLPPEEVRYQLEWADLFLHSAVSEGFCNAVMEAQASCLPVVCTDADGLPENVEHGVTGIVVPRRDPGAIADAIVELAANPARRMRMGAAGRDRVERCFGVGGQIDAFVSLYAAVLARNVPA